ncbi:hypothetical protein AGOR_G00172190 [Albula goreensis]|uniref:Ig-like domain-containing protein n=1 Tax=Albula goreensis TaxID=1534307 RepID=A0A8T3D1T9_9TELE|nr:hypothetical protein AGOR_G00172190 [Albula goreensis]
MEKMILHCPAPERNSTGWTLRHLADSRVQSGCRPVGGDASREKPEVCTISRLYSGNSGLYWCESDEGDQRTNAVNITVVYGHVSIQGPTQPVAEGDSVTLRCLHWQKSANTTAFYRNGVEILPHSGTEMTIHSATIADQGFYKCAVSNGTESPETWLSVRGNLTFQPTFPTEVQTSSKKGAGSWLMVVVPCCILGILVVVALGLLAFRRSGCSLAGYFAGGSPKEEVPQTKPDATEIQWDLPWMEMEATAGSDSGTGAGKLTYN